MQLSRRSAQRAQSGDTIVEVLIAVAIISLVLVSAYAITSRNTATNQDTQERNQAQQIVQRQIELLRTMAQAQATPAPLPGFASNNCIVGSVGSLQFKNNLTGDCNFLPDGTNCGTVQPCYKIEMQRDAGAKIYTVTASWTSLRGGDSTVSMEYGV